MSILAQRYGMTRPRAITAMLQALQAAVPALPVLALAPAKPASTPEAAEIKAARVAAHQAERAQIRADLAFMRSYAANYDDGPTFEEIAALEACLNDLDDYLIFEIDPLYDVAPLAA